MGGDLETTIENLEVKTPRLILCYNELHMIFCVFWLNCVFLISMNYHRLNGSRVLLALEQDSKLGDPLELWQTERQNLEK